MNTLEIKAQFPIFTHSKDLIYLDSAATSLKPRAVIDAEKGYLEQYSANVGRGLYPLAETATEKFEGVREKMATFIGAASSKEIIFTSGTTHSINLAAGLLEHFIQPGDNIVVTELEHHSNFLPWKELSRRKNIELRIVPIDADGCINTATLSKLTDENTAIVAFSAVSNVTGAISPVADIVKLVKTHNPKAIAIVDAAQAVGHMPIDVSDWNADFVAFSAHKMFGTTGVGILYGKSRILETLSPVAFGGGMVLDIYPPRRACPPKSSGRGCAAETLYKDIPHRFEAGTPNIGGVIALGAALGYIESIGLENIRAHERALTEYALKELEGAFGDAIRIIGPKDAKDRSGIIAFSFGSIYPASQETTKIAPKNNTSDTSSTKLWCGVHPHDIAHLLGEQNICVRAGEHCAAPLHRALRLDATTRLSFSIYNDENDIDRLIEALKKITLLLK